MSLFKTTGSALLAEAGLHANASFPQKDNAFRVSSRERLITRFSKILQRKIKANTRKIYAIFPNNSVIKVELKYKGRVKLRFSIRK